MEVINSSIVARALDHYEEKNIDFIDGYIVAVMEKLNINDIYSFDRKHLARITGLKRIEP